MAALAALFPAAAGFPAGDAAAAATATMCRFRPTYEPTEPLERFHYHLKSLADCYNDLDAHERTTMVHQLLESQPLKLQARIADLVGTVVTADVPAIQSLFTPASSSECVSGSSSFEGQATTWEDFLRDAAATENFADLLA